MNRLTLYRVLVVVAAIAVLEALCLGGAIDRITMQPPHQIARDFARLILSGSMNHAIAKTLGNAAFALLIALVAGVSFAAMLHRLRALRSTLDPLFATYYAIPVFAFYPLFIVMFGLGDGPQVLIGVLLGIVAVIVTTLNGLDRVPQVLRKTAAIARLSPLNPARSITPTTSIASFTVPRRSRPCTRPRAVTI